MRKAVGTGHREDPYCSMDKEERTAWGGWGGFRPGERQLGFTERR